MPDARSRPEVAQVVKPLNEENGFADFNHGATVAPWLHIVNAIRAVLRCPTNERDFPVPRLRRKPRSATTHAEIKATAFEYIEIFYNRKRQHSTLGYRSPVQFLENWIREHQEKLVA
ncbi:MAG: IS3 family transposase [Betaproteobacteria bacterium]|nr:IS3 family transposase [Betaproteobacteria bacterium]